ncbi:Gfo/Idh/MocA family protein [Oenococcus oeni]|uniref:Gfo/Idh/MocA family protein n=1 Tax=Oenococcus oeni TaxID=1247 RepID=UPI000510143E|nr:Gfo/Idh/MocA family oxidoreductase [Oenococcus oeni]KGH58293.1 oxidoreductase [Oenococcus oeni IOEB_B10]
MIKLGLVGTHWITAQFAQAVLETGKYEISAIYSRNKENAKKFSVKIQQNKASLYDNFDDFIDSGIQVVYLASPNSFHFEHAQIAIKHDVDVIVEKPSFSNPDQFRTIIDLLKLHPKIRLFEAARNYHDPNFKVVQSTVKNLDLLQGANLVYAHYSSRYDEYLAKPDNPPNVFTRDFSGGALYDLGVYPLYDALGWFGYPEKIDYKAQLLKNGIDAFGWINLKYSGFSVGIFISKVFTSTASTEIFGLKHTIEIDSPSELNQIAVINGHDKQFVADGSGRNPLFNEADDFARVLNDRFSEKNQSEYEKWLKTATQINQLLFDLRKSAGIDFPADNQ